MCLAILKNEKSSWGFTEDKCVNVRLSSDLTFSVCQLMYFKIIGCKAIPHSQIICRRPLIFYSVRAHVWKQNIRHMNRCCFALKSPVWAQKLGANSLCHIIKFSVDYLPIFFLQPSTLIILNLIIEAVANCVSWHKHIQLKHGPISA